MSIVYALALIEIVAFLSLLVTLGGILWARSVLGSNKKMRDKDPVQRPHYGLPTVNLVWGRSRSTEAELDGGDNLDWNLVHSPAYEGVLTSQMSSEETTYNNSIQVEGNAFRSSHNPASDDHNPTYEEISSRPN